MNFPAVTVLANVTPGPELGHVYGPNPKRLFYFRRHDEIDSHTYWLMEQANNQVGDELVLNIREGAPIRLTRAQVQTAAVNSATLCHC